MNHEYSAVASAVAAEAPSKSVGGSSRNWPAYIFAASLLAFLALALANSLARAPWWDEGLFSDVALNFRRFGHFGNTLLAPNGYIPLPGVHQYTYWQMPLYLVGLGTWLHLVPFNILDVRLFSLLWGVVYIGAWYAFVRGLGQTRAFALFVAAMIALDYSVIAASSNGRMEMMCAALGQLALAAYVCLRDKNWPLALIVASWFGAAAFFTHPMGAIPNGFLAVLILLDWSRIRWWAFFAAAVPFLLGIGACALYASHNPALYRAQSFANSSYRISTVKQIFHHLVFDFEQRYLGFYLINQYGVNKLKIFGLLFGLAGVVALLLNRRLRALTVSRVFLILAGASYIFLAILDNQTFPIYFVYSLPFLTACGATWVFFERPGSRARKLAYVFLAGSLFTTIAGFGDKLYRNENRLYYRPVVNAIVQNASPGATIMGGSQLGFALGFDNSRYKIIDDRFVGYFSGIKPELYVWDPFYVVVTTPDRHLAWNVSRQTLKDHYHVVYKSDAYQVYKLNNPAEATK
ncbi:MAG TPA: hypothetical protein VHZ55_07205 [Bryobacteraceae bacterium]|nr:hypothetical protein [Bryobacteraceae bacterium]